MAISKEKYIDIANDDRITITVLFDAMSIKERMEAVLYLLDTMNCDSMPKVKEFMKDDNNLHIRCIKDCLALPETKGNDDVLIQKAVELYYEKTNTKPEEVKEEIERTEHKENFYSLLTKKD